jgi:putative protease
VGGYIVSEKEIGTITKYYSKIGVAVIKLSSTIKVGDTIILRGATTDFSQTVESLQVEKESIQKAGAGKEIALKVKDKVRENDKVFLSE